MPTARQRLHERVRLCDGVTILTFWQRTISLFSWRSLSFPVQTYGCYSWVTRQLCACLVRVFFSQKGLGLLKFLYEKQNSHFHVILKMCLFYCIVGVHFIYSDPYFERQLERELRLIVEPRIQEQQCGFSPLVAERWSSSLPSHARWDSLGICHSSQTCVLTSRVFFKWGCCRTTGFPASDSCFRIPSINLSVFSVALGHFLWSCSWFSQTGSQGPADARSVSGSGASGLRLCLLQSAWFCLPPRSGTFSTHWKGSQLSLKQLGWGSAP